MKPHKCEICDDTLSKYKCPKCGVRYCSVACFKTHKENSCEKKDDTRDSRPVSTPLTDLNLGEAEMDTSEDTVPPERLQKLGESDELKSILENPHLRQIMKNLTASANPAADMEKCMQEPIFVEFADQCLTVVEDQEIPCLPEG